LKALGAHFAFPQFAANAASRSHERMGNDGDDRIVVCALILFVLFFVLLFFCSGFYRFLCFEFSFLF
jgi:ABC-type multidrug transport system permease subunit